MATKRLLAGADPYLVWAQFSEFKGYDRGTQPYGYQIALEKSDLNFPWKIDPNAERKFQDQRRICNSGSGAIWTGTVDDATFNQLVRSGVPMELNVPQNHSAFAGGGGTDTVPLFKGLTERVIAVIDHGCPFGHQQFLLKTSRRIESRVRYLWDQGGEPKRYEGWYPVNFDGRDTYGREMATGDLTSTGSSMSHKIREATVNGLLDEDLLYRSVGYDVMDIRKTHGAHVLDIAAGQVNPLTGEKDPASEADLIFVQLPRNTYADTSGGSMTKYVLDALKYIFARTPNVKHLAINLSYGSTAGPHDGSSLLERAIDELIKEERKKRKHLEIVLPAGNHFLAQGHTAFVLETKSPSQDMRWHVMPDNQTDTFLEVWYEAQRGMDVEISVTSPNGLKIGPVKLGDSNKITTQVKGKKNKLIGAVVHSAKVPNGANAMALIAVGPTHAEPTADRQPAPHGIWTIHFNLAKRADPKGRVVVNAWVERDDPLPGQVGQPQSYLFSNRLDRNIDDDDKPSDTVKRRTTGNSLANGVEPVVVGACINTNGTPCDYAAAGPTLNSHRNAQRSWPDCLAVGDESFAIRGVLAAGTRSGILVRMNGSSVAAPQIVRKMINAWASGVQTPFPKPPTVNPTDPLPKQRLGEFAQTYARLRWTP